MNSIQPPAQKAEFIFQKPTQREVAARLGLTRSQVQFAEKNALRKIARYLVNRGYGAAL